MAANSLPIFANMRASQLCALCRIARRSNARCVAQRGVVDKPVFKTPCYAA
jgi:hypothetical protein